MIQLPKRVQFSETVKRVKMACFLPGLISVTTIGNGLVNVTSKGVAPILQFTSLETITFSKCLKYFPFLGMRKSVICAKGKEEHGVCFGDSGGPLIDNKSGALVGVTSFVSIDGCIPGHPQGFSYVPIFFKWIKRVTGITECQSLPNYW